MSEQKGKEDGCICGREAGKESTVCACKQSGGGGCDACKETRLVWAKESYPRDL